MWCVNRAIERKPFINGYGVWSTIKGTFTKSIKTIICVALLKNSINGMDKVNIVFLLAADKDLPIYGTLLFLANILCHRDNVKSLHIKTFSDLLALF